MSQLELFEQPVVRVSTTPSVESVRARLEAVLAVLRSASEFPWTAREAARWKLIFPQMAGWLPAEERDAARAEFARLIEGLEARAALFRGPSDASPPTVAGRLAPLPPPRWPRGGPPPR